MEKFRKKVITIKEAKSYLYFDWAEQNNSEIEKELNFTVERNFIERDMF